MKNFKGKAIYNPSGKAGEYSYWACNFYVGCSNGCEYCYCKKGILADAMGMDKPQLKKCFIDGGYHKLDRSIWMDKEDYALYMFEYEMNQNAEELRKHGIFFSFTTDPMLPETMDLTWMAAEKATALGIPVKILTKRADWVDEWINFKFDDDDKHLYALGFTITGHDELEPNASTNQERIEAMKKLKEVGFKTWASIEPIIDFESSFKMMQQCRPFCDLFKIGLMSGKKHELSQVKWFVNVVNDQFSANRIYFKDSLLKTAKIVRTELPLNCINRDYNIFTV